MPSVKHPKTLKTVPKILSMFLYLFGTNLQDNYVSSLDHRGKKQRISEKKTTYWTKFNLIFSHTMYVIANVWLYFGAENLFFFILGSLDAFTFIFTQDILYSRRDSVRSVIMRLQQLPTQGKKKSKCCRFFYIQIILWFSALLTAFYIVYSFAVFTHSDDSMTESEEEPVHLLGIFLKVLIWTIHILYTYEGLSVYLCLFIHFCLLMQEKLQMINRSLKAMLKQRVYEVRDLQKQRRIYCTLQDIVSEANDVFADICFMWITRIICRSCGSVYHMSTQSWTGQGFILQLLFVMDTVFDILYLSLMCLFAEGIVKSKSEILEPLIGLCGLSNVHMVDCALEIHFFLCIVGHSPMAMTVGNISPLSMNFAATILGVIGSNGVIIFQLSASK
ncbi:uncharacterized protein NPIL_102241 [Nephila pilipes]|uniref:Gustatory receptor n=1 Tax=Nephila pilipes TaxID=299642 RepID=A0A8X6MU18_NEPPI|nr:uncharacterized protein NPIL_102241 [Nephila pilipes]